jgi:hypothetical protein
VGAQCLNLKISPKTKSLGSFFKGSGPKQPEDRFSILFFPFGGQLGTPKWSQKGIQSKGPQVSRMYGPMSKPKNKPKTKSSGIEVVQNNQKTGFEVQRAPL